MLNTEFFIGQGDTRDPLIATVYGEDGTTPVDLTDCTVMFSMRTELGEVLIDEAAATIEGNPTLGMVRYDWKPASGEGESAVAGDTDRAGVFQAKFIVLAEGDARFSAPNEGYITVNVTPF